MPAAAAESVSAYSSTMDTIASPAWRRLCAVPPRASCSSFRSRTTPGRPGRRTHHTFGAYPPPKASASPAALAATSRLSLV